QDLEQRAIEGVAFLVERHMRSSERFAGGSALFTTTLDGARPRGRKAARRRAGRYQELFTAAGEAHGFVEVTEVRPYGAHERQRRARVPGGAHGLVEAHGFLEEREGSVELFSLVVQHGEL